MDWSKIALESVGSTKTSSFATLKSLIIKEPFMFLRSNFSGLKIVTPLFPPKYKVPSELFMAAPSLYSLT